MPPLGLGSRRMVPLGQCGRWAETRTLAAKAGSWRSWCDLSGPAAHGFPLWGALQGVYALYLTETVCGLQQCRAGSWAQKAPIVGDIS